LAKLLRAGELSALWVPDERHEAMRDLLRALKGREEVTKEIVRTARELFKQGTSWTQHGFWQALVDDIQMGDFATEWTVSQHDTRGLILEHGDDGIIRPGKSDGEAASR